MVFYRSAMCLFTCECFDGQQGLESLTNLRVLSLQSNRITKLENLSHLIHLEELYISHNGLTSMQGVEKLVRVLILFWYLAILYGR